MAERVASQTRFVNNTVDSQWADPDNVFAENNLCTSTSTDLMVNTYDFTNNPFTIPADATITGLYVLLRWGGDGNDTFQIYFKDALGVSQGAQGTPSVHGCADASLAWSGEDGDLWGGTWTPAHINFADFQCWIRYLAQGKAGTMYIDFIEVTVYYALPISDGSVALLGKADIKNAGSAELLGKVDVRHVGTPLEVFAFFTATMAGTRSLPAGFDVLGLSSGELPAKLTVRQDSRNLLARALIRNQATADLGAKLLPTYPAYGDLSARFTVWQLASVDLSGRFEVGRGSRDLPAKALIISLPVIAEQLGAGFQVCNGLHWLTGWSRRKEHRVVGSTVGPLTDYPVSITVHYGSGTDTDDDVYCDEKCRTDFGDIRFTDYLGNELDYWLQEKIDSDYAVFWVEVDEIPKSPAWAIIYVYYDNPSATTTSDGDDTFTFFDDFTEDRGWTIGNAEFIQIIEEEDCLWIDYRRPASDLYCYRSVSGLTDGFELWIDSWYDITPGLDDWVHGWFNLSKDNDGSRHAETEVYGIEAWGEEYSNKHGLGFWNGVGLTRSIDGDADPDSDRFIYRIRKHDTRLEYYCDSANIADGTAVVSAGIPAIAYMKAWIGDTVAGTIDDDARRKIYLIRLRKWVYPEPAHGAWYSTETFNDLLGKFGVRQSDSAELLGKTEIQHPGSADLLAKFQTGEDSRDLFARFESQSIRDLLARVIIRNIGSAYLFGGFEAQATAELLCRAEVGQDSVELFVRFEVGQDSEGLLGKLTVRHSTSVDLPARSITRHADDVDLPSVSKIRHPVTADLLERFTVRGIIALALFCKFTVRQLASVDLLGGAKVGRLSGVDLSAKSDITHLASLLGRVVIRHVGAPLEFSARCEIRHTGTADLLGRFAVRQSGSANLEAVLGVTHSRVLLGRFKVGQDFVDLLVKFMIGRDSKDLFARFESQTIRDLLARAKITDVGSAELLGEAAIRQVGTPIELLARFEVGQDSGALKALFLIPRAYDFSGSMGISFYWWGSGGMDQNIDFEMRSLTGGWLGEFPDGPAEWRQIQLSWDDLTEVDLDGTRPDRSQIIGFYWTYHTPGVRRLAGIQAWMRQDLLGKFFVRNARSLDLLSKFEAQATAELLSRAEVRQPASTELLGRAEVGQNSAGLLGKFEAQATLDLLGKVDITHSVDLLGKFDVGQATAELLGKGEVRQPGSTELLSRAAIRHIGTPMELLGGMNVIPA